MLTKNLKTTRLGSTLFKIGVFVVNLAIVVSPVVSLGSDFNPGATAPANGLPPYGANLFNTASAISSGASTALPVSSSPSRAVERSGGALRDSGAVASLGANTSPSGSRTGNGANTSDSNARLSQGSSSYQGNSNFNVTLASTNQVSSAPVAYQTASVIDATEAPAVPALPRTGGGGRTKR